MFVKTASGLANYPESELIMRVCDQGSQVKPVSLELVGSGL